MPYLFIPPPDLIDCHDCGDPVPHDQLTTFDEDGWRYCRPCAEYLTHLLAGVQQQQDGDVVAR